MQAAGRPVSRPAPRPAAPRGAQAAGLGSPEGHRHQRARGADAPPPLRRSSRRRPSPVCAAAAFDPSHISVGEQLGEGSFGTVFLGTLRQPGRAAETVVLKRAKGGVEDAEEARLFPPPPAPDPHPPQVLEHEVAFNERVTRDARGACAPFLGVCRVPPASARGRLVSGTWLAWAFEGRYTLSHYLRLPDYPFCLARPLFGDSRALDGLAHPELAVAQAVLQQLLSSLRALHALGLVHRDVKPLNLVLDERGRRFKLIDLGACADLRTGANFAPDETILDPKYSPPEEFLMPVAAAPDLAAAYAPLALALGATAWARFGPDRFDVWSSGVVLLQLLVPQLRSDRGLRAFNSAVTGVGLEAWRRGCAAEEAAALDAHSGAAWTLAQSLLAPRPPGWAEGRNGAAGGRASAESALASRFFSLQPASLGSEEAASGRVARAAAAAAAALSATEVEMSGTRRRLARLRAAAAEAAAAPAPELAAAEAASRGAETLWGRLRAGLEGLLGEPSAQRAASVASDLAAEGAPEDTPAAARRRAPRTAAAAAAAGGAALAGMRREAQPAPAGDAAGLSGELAEVSERLAAMQARMAQLLADNERVLGALEGPGGKRAAAAAAAANAAIAEATAVLAESAAARQASEEG